MTREEFCLRLGVERSVLEVWFAEGWFQTGNAGAPADLSELDLARAQFVRHLLQDMGVNAEGVGIILDLVDQLHGLRFALRSAAGAYAAASGWSDREQD